MSPYAGGRDVARRGRFLIPNRPISRDSSEKKVNIRTSFVRPPSVSGDARKLTKVYRAPTTRCVPSRPRAVFVPIRSHVRCIAPSRCERSAYRQLAAGGHIFHKNERDFALVRVGTAPEARARASKTPLVLRCGAIRRRSLVFASCRTRSRICVSIRDV